MSKYCFLLILLFASNTLFAQRYRTQALSSEIKTIEINAMGQWGKDPIIVLDRNEHIAISFDRLGDNSFNRLRYNVFLCNANWTKNNSTSEIEYLDGFNNNLIEDYNSSINTTVDYTHFSLEIPNRDVRLKLSGNYVVEIFDEDNSDEILLTTCFSVSEQTATVGYSLYTVTNIDANKEHQQVSLFINHNLNLRDHNELKTYIYQNNRLETERLLQNPTKIIPTQVAYDRSNELIFEAGNEYRRFESTSRRHNGMRIAHIEYQSPYYQTYVETDYPRTNKGYSYDQDQNGRYMLRSSDTSYPDTEGDYFETTFTLPMENPLTNNVYLNGQFTNNTFNNTYLMKYDNSKQEYYLSLLLKQGLYNYQYLAKTEKGCSAKNIEGNYFQTENEYNVYVYYRPIGQRYDRLIGTITLYSRQK